MSELNMVTDIRPDPFRSCPFVLHVDGVPRAVFSEVSGLAASGRADEYREAVDDRTRERAVPGPRTSARLSLKRGYALDQALRQWHEQLASGRPARRSVTIVQIDERRQPVLRWHAEHAWIEKIEGPSLKADGHEVAIESVDLVHEGLTIG